MPAVCCLLHLCFSQFSSKLYYFSGEGNGNPAQYSCLWNPTDRGGGLLSMESQESDTTEQLNRQYIRLQGEVEATWGQSQEDMSFITTASGCRIPCSLDGLSGLGCTCGFGSVFFFFVPSLFFCWVRWWLLFRQILFLVIFSDRKAQSL